MKKINLKLKEQNYPILIGRNLIETVTEISAKKKLPQNILLIADGNVDINYRNQFALLSESFSGKSDYYIVKPGEGSKSFKELNKIYSFLLEKNYGRDTLIIAAGGGVVGDLSGYAASTFVRGVKLIHLSTTLLAMVDSAIGGKTGINFNDKKNMIGTFFQPEAVISDLNFLNTLPDGELTSGIGEIIKYTFMSDEMFYEFVEKNLDNIYKKEYKILEEIVFRSAEIKAAIVMQDVKESGMRKMLNLGHTFGHAYESELNFKIKHGEAVTAGIISSLYLSNRLGIISKEKLKKFLSLPLKIKLPDKFFMMNKENLISLMQSDKKTRGGKIKFVLVQDIGKILLDVDAERNDVFYAIERTQELLAKPR